MENPFSSTDNREIHKNTHHQAEHYRHILDSVLPVVFTLDQNFRFVYVNAVSRAIWGYAPEELTGKCCLELVFDGDREKTARYLQDQISGQSIANFQNLFSKKDQSLVPMSWAGRWDENDQLLYCVVRDITERKRQASLLERYKDELEKQNEDMASILERITDGFFAVNNNWEIVYWNKEAEWMLGKGKEAVLGKNLWELFPSAADSEFFIQYLRAIDQQTPVYFEAYYAPRKIWAEMSVYPSVHGLSVFFKNINERKRLEEELKIQQRQHTAAVISAQEKERSLISEELHDNVNQLLTSAKLYAALGSSGGADPEEMLEKTVSLLQSAIDEIRKLSKRLSVSLVTKTGLEDAVRELVETIADANELSINLTMEFPSPLRAAADPQLAIYRILQEHLTNVSKHAGATWVDVNLRESDEKLTLTVVDNGSGFDVRKKAEGIGIANMRSRAESLMGIFVLDSEPGKGCTLLVQLPLTN